MDNIQNEILGIGAPVVDHIIEVPDSFLNKIGGDKGGMMPVDYQTLKKIIAECEQAPLLVTGGSAANALRGLSNFGHKCAFLGKIGSDEVGAKVRESLARVHITAYLKETETPTAQVLCLITPDGDRTMRSYFGASQEMTENDLDPALFEDVKLVHIESYRLYNGSLVQKAMELAKQAGAKVSFDLGSFEVVESHKEKIIELLTKYVDIVFGNRDEIRSLTELDPEKGCEIIKDLCETVVVLMGKEGCLVGNGPRVMKFPAYPVENPVDTTGAGDFFASGFLHGYLLDRSFDECAHFGALAGAAVVQVKGVDISDQMWMQIKSRMAIR